MWYCAIWWTLYLIYVIFFKSMRNFSNVHIYSHLLFCILYFLFPLLLLPACNTPQQVINKVLWFYVIFQLILSYLIKVIPMCWSQQTKNAQMFYCKYLNVLLISDPVFQPYLKGKVFIPVMNGPAQTWGKDEPLSLQSPWMASGQEILVAYHSLIQLSLSSFSLSSLGPFSKLNALNVKKKKKKWKEFCVCCMTRH